jgi:hypothetical protein
MIFNMNFNNISGSHFDLWRKHYYQEKTLSFPKVKEEIYNLRLYPVHPTICRNKTNSTNTGNRDLHIEQIEFNFVHIFWNFGFMKNVFHYFNEIKSSVLVENMTLLKDMTFWILTNMTFWI